LYTYQGGDNPKNRVSIHIAPERLDAHGF
jgi:hypothetical protein